MFFSGSYDWDGQIPLLFLNRRSGVRGMAGDAFEGKGCYNDKNRRRRREHGE